MGPLRKTGNRFRRIDCLELLPHSGAVWLAQLDPVLKLVLSHMLDLEFFGAGASKISLDKRFQDSVGSDF